MIQSGDVVIDCGAHIGTFTHSALDAGAAKVISVEPSPLLTACLRRTFGREIAEGRVALVEKGVWESEGTLTFRTDPSNTAASGVILNASFQRSGDVTIPVTTVDQIVRENKLTRVDLIKMDIEGSERHALAASANRLRQFRPGLSIAAYHRPDDTEVLPV